jgi:uncharacterized protein YjbI with pentapeptide repeats
MKIYTQEELKEILKSHHEWLTTPGGIRADLSYANLSDADLSDANLRRANLSDANLRRANLSDADLSYADLSDADLSGANLSGADLSDADLSDANLRRANLSGADLRHAILKHADLSYANLSGADLSDADLSGANLSDANLRRANLSDADLSGADLSDADLSGANLSGADLSDAKGLLDPIKYIEKNFEKTKEGIIVYKSFGEHYTPNPNWKIAEGSIIEEVVNPLPTVECGCGVNVATKEWVNRECTNPVWECLIKWEWLPGVVVPYQTDGKIRASKVQLIKPVDL